MTDRLLKIACIEIVQDMLSDDVKAHADRIEPDPQKREVLQATCSHEDWNQQRRWCNRCGIALWQRVFREHEKN